MKRRSISTMVVAALCLLSGCVRFGFDTAEGRPDGSTDAQSAAEQGARDQSTREWGHDRGAHDVTLLDGGPSDASPDTSPTTDSSVDGPMSTAASCQTVGAAPEAWPAHGGHKAYLRPSHTMSSFCLDTPDPAAGDALCKEQLGSAYSWFGGGTSSSSAHGAALELDTYARGTRVHLVGKPENTSGWRVHVSNCINTSNPCGGLAFYDPECLPTSGVYSRLLCGKKQADAVLIANNVDSDGVTVAGVYDLKDDQYKVVYMTNRYSTPRELRYVSFDPYLKSISASRYVADATPTTPMLRLARGASTAGASRLFVAWQRQKTSAVRRHVALLAGDGTVVSPPTDAFGFDCYNANGQQAVTYDSRRHRFLLLGSGNESGDVDPISMFGQFYSADSGAAVGNRFMMTNGSPNGLYGHYLIEAAYDAISDRHLVVNRQDAFLISPTGSTTHRSTGETLYAVAANRDRGGFLALGRLLSKRGGVVRFDGNGVMQGSLQQWSSEEPRSVTGGMQAGEGLEAAYIPLSSNGAHQGRFWVRHGELYRVLEDEGTGCFPADARVLDMERTSAATIIVNTKTGGFVVLYVDTTTNALQARVYLSNGEPY
jgi:hypothetical protein